MQKKPAILVLADGSVYEGYGVGASGFGIGELVFNTAMTGYQEMISDPSYCHQLLMFTSAHIGNTGCNADDMESSKAWAAGVVMRDCVALHSNYRSALSLPEWLESQGVVGISGVDTRALTRKLRDNGAMGACIATDINQIEQAKAFAKSAAQRAGGDLAKLVSRQTIERWHDGRGDWCPKSRSLRFHVVVYDYGVKHTILRILHDLGCHLTIVPAHTSASDVLALNPHGILLSNGPGDPKACQDAIVAIKALLEANVPLFGICLGFQLLGLACGANTYKMKFGHHGANHPVIEVDAPHRVMITSQNHGFAIDEATLPPSLQVTHRSLFDNSLQGIRHKEKRAFGFQGHPESSPGPHDIELIFNEFITAME